jgi:hypothetical protein
LARNRYITDITCPFSLSTANNNTRMQCQHYTHNSGNQETNCIWQHFPEQSVKKLSVLKNQQVHHSVHKRMIVNYILSEREPVYKLHTPSLKHILILFCHLSISSPCSLFC